MNMSVEQKQAHRTDWRSPKQAGEGSIRSLGLADATSTYRARRQQALLYSTGNHTQRPVINHNGKEHENKQTYAWLPRWPSGNPTASAGGARDTGLIPTSGRSPGGGNDSPLQYFAWKTP